jgi:hypothetical protein
VLAEEPDRKIVIGAYAQPWHEQVTFHPLPPEEFARFNRPGYVKIVWTLGAEPLGPNKSRFITRTRAVATDPEARRKFRRYWAPMSAGIILIRYTGLPLIRKEAERRAAHTGQERQHGMGNRRGGWVIEHAVEVRRSPDEVFDYCTDLRREPWGFHTGSGAVAKAALGLGAPLLAAVIWACGSRRPHGDASPTRHGW